MCNKSVNTFPSIAQIVAECYKTQENCIVDACPFVFDSVPDWYKTHESVIKLFLLILLWQNIALNRYKTQEMYDKAVDDFISIIKFAPDCLLQVKWWKASQCFIASCFNAFINTLFWRRFWWCYIFNWWSAYS